MHDDDTGWHEVLLDSWSPRLRAAVVDRIERATVGRRGLLVRALSDPDGARFALTEQVHRLVLAGIRDEVGADLDELGSQAAWACYEEVWDVLAGRWATGGATLPVPTGREELVAELLARLPPTVAECAGADTGTVPVTPLSVGGVMRVDLEGLWACVTVNEGRLSPEVRATIDRLIGALDGG